MRHDLVLREIVEAIKLHLTQESTLAVDIGKGYQFPLHIVQTNLRPDIVWWNSRERSVCFAELTVCFESNFSEAAQQKIAKYADLVHQAKCNSYNTVLLTLEVGSRGLPNYTSFIQLAHTLRMPKHDLHLLLQHVSRAAIEGSFTIWCLRNRQT